MNEKPLLLQLILRAMHANWRSFTTSMSKTDESIFGFELRFFTHLLHAWGTIFTI